MAAPDDGNKGRSPGVRAAEKMRIARQIGSESFEANTRILQGMAWRGLRAFVVFGVGVGTFAFAMRRRRSEMEVTRDANEPTLRYLEEMRGLGFDVDAVEEELEADLQRRNAAGK